MKKIALIACAAAGLFGQTGQAPTTYLEAPFNYSGETATLKIRVNSPNGAAALSALQVYMVQGGSGPVAWLSIVVIPTPNGPTIEVRAANQTPPATPLRFSPGTGTLGAPFGPPPFQLLGYTFPDPANSGNLFQVDLVLRRLAPATGPMNIFLIAADSVSQLFSEPGLNASAGTWSYDPPSNSNFTLGTSSIDALAGRYETRVRIDGLAAAPSVTANQAWLQVSDIQPNGFKVVILATTDSTAKTNGLITVTAGSVTKTIPVTQAAVVQQAPVLQLQAPVMLDGEIATIKARVTAPNGASSLTSLDVLIGAVGYYQVTIDLQARKVMMWDMWSNPGYASTSWSQLPTGTFTHMPFGFAPM